VTTNATEAPATPEVTTEATDERPAS
jgi:hypothetical protein